MQRYKALLIVLLALVFCAASAMAQTREEGPWWPHPIWGAGDQAGGSNWITPEKIMDSLKMVTTGKVYEIGQVYERGMPLFGQRTYAMFANQAGPFGDNMLMGHDDFLCAEIGQVGTQFDGPAHIGMRMTMADGTSKDVYYNGFTEQDDLKGFYGVESLGIENVKPYITRGVLVDVAGYRGVDTLDHSYEVTMDDVRGALARQGISEASINDGDALFFNYGWSKLWGDPDTYNTNPPGIGMEVAAWIVAQNASMVGSDSWPTEVWPSPTGLVVPVHQELITKAGIFNLENMVFDSVIADGVYEFLYIFTPIRFKGGTGSPARPLAIR